MEGTALDAYDRLVRDYETVFGQAQEKLRQLRAHPGISVERETSALNIFLEDFRRRMEQAKAEHPAEALATATDRITAVFHGRVGLNQQRIS